MNFSTSICVEDIVQMDERLHLKQVEQWTKDGHTLWWGHRQEILQLEVAHPYIILQEVSGRGARATGQYLPWGSIILLHDGKEQTPGSKPKHCSCEEPFTPCFIQPHNGICGCAGDFSIHHPPSTFRSPSTETACRWRFVKLTCTFRGRSLERECKCSQLCPNITPLAHSVAVESWWETVLKTPAALCASPSGKQG